MYNLHEGVHSQGPAQISSDNSQRDRPFVFQQIYLIGFHWFNFSSVVMFIIFHLFRICCQHWCQNQTWSSHLQCKCTSRRLCSNVQSARRRSLTRLRKCTSRWFCCNVQSARRRSIARFSSNAIWQSTTRETSRYEWCIIIIANGHGEWTSHFCQWLKHMQQAHK